jgi:large subunit ribosomal protein L15
MQLHELKRANAHAKVQRVGRGGKRGKTAGRGTKGQKARAGHRMRPEMRDIIKKYPKLRGYKFSSVEVKPAVVNLAALEIHFANGDTVSPATLVEKKIVRKESGKIPAIKLLAKGTLSKKVTVEGLLMSDTAKAAVEAAGGTVIAKVLKPVVA